MTASPQAVSVSISYLTKRNAPQLQSGDPVRAMCVQFSSVLTQSKLEVPNFTFRGVQQIIFCVCSLVLLYLSYFTFTLRLTTLKYSIIVDGFPLVFPYCTFNLTCKPLYVYFTFSGFGPSFFFCSCSCQVRSVRGACMSGSVRSGSKCGVCGV